MPMLTKLFGFNPKETTIRTEIFAGITTFLTMSYILAVNPAMFSVLDGMPAGAAFTATALAAVIGTLVMAFWAKLPFGLAPGMGLNAFFVYTVCLGMGYPRTCQVPCLSASWRQHSLASRWESLNSREYSHNLNPLRTFSVNSSGIISLRWTCWWWYSPCCSWTYSIR